MKKSDAIAVLEQAFGVKLSRTKKYGGEGTLTGALYIDCCDDPLAIPEGLEIKTVERVGGCEGGGEDYHEVMKVTVKTSGESFFVKIRGSYQSYEGVIIACEDLTIVEPYERTITDYREVAE